MNFDNANLDFIAAALEVAMENEGDAEQYGEYARLLSLINTQQGKW